MVEFLRPIAELAPRWYWDFVVAGGVLFTVFVTIVGGPLFAVFPAMGVLVAAVFSWIRRKPPIGPADHTYSRAWALFASAWLAMFVVVGASFLIERF